MDWKNRSDQPQSRYEPDEGNTFEETDFIDASTYQREGNQPAAVPPPADHASYDQPVTDPVFANRGPARRERQSSFSTQRLGGGGRSSGSRRSLPLLLLLGALLAIPLIGGLWWFLNRDGGDTPTTTAPVPSPSITVNRSPSPSASPNSSTSPSGSASARPSTSASPSVSASPSTAPGTYVVAGEGLRLRDGPSSTANVITTLAEGTQVQATGVTTNADGREWRQVRVNGSEGWAADEFLRPAP